MLRPARMQKLSILVNKERVSEFLEYTGKTQLIHLVNAREKLSDDSGLSAYPATQYLSQCLGLKNRVRVLIEQLQVGPRQTGNSPAARLSISDGLSMLEREVAAIEEKSREVIHGKERALQEMDRLEQASRVYEFMESFGLDNERLGSFMFLSLIMGEIPIENIDIFQEAVRKATYYNVVTFTHDSPSKERKRVSILYPRAFDAHVRRTLTTFNVNIFEVPSDGGSFSKDGILARQREVAEGLKASERKIEDLRKSIGQSLLTLLRLSDTLELRIRALGQGGATETTCYLEGWVPSDRAGAFIEGARKACGDNVSVTRELHTDERPPTLIRYPQFAAPFQKLVNAFSIPSHDEINPTPLVLLTFPIFYGAMFADIGQGAIFVVVGLLSVYAKRKGIQAGEFIGFVLNGAEAILLAGVSATVFGFLFGDVFGFKSEEILGFHALWLEPRHEPIVFMKIAIMAGVIHISFGLILNIINKFSRGHKVLALTRALPWLWLYLGGVYFVFTYGLDLTKWFSKPLELLLGMAAPFVIMGVGEGVAGLVVHKEPIGHVMGLVGEGFFQAFEALLSSAGNTASYLRIVALNMAHGILGFAVNMLWVIPAPTILLGIFVAVLNVGVMILEGLIVFMHSLRLHWVEWFSKFYEGEGFPYTPYAE